MKMRHPWKKTTMRKMLTARKKMASRKKSAVRVLTFIILTIFLTGCSFADVEQKAAELRSRFLSIGQSAAGQGSGADGSEDQSGNENGGLGDAGGSGDSGETGADGNGSTDGGDWTAENPFFQLGRELLENATQYEDYLPEGTSLFVNNAPVFYYYTQITEEERVMYDGLWAVLQDPTSTEYRKEIKVSADPASDEFMTEMSRAYQALIYDHPELFWFRQSSGNFKYYYRDIQNTDGQYSVMLQMTEPYEGYEAEMTAFNNAVNEFLAGIDLTQPQPYIALQIHDKLIDLVTYDTDLAAQYTADSAYDYGYSAYGALVANSRGQWNTAVCDGYTYAFQYLCQMAGLTVTHVSGQAGDSPENAEAHSWNLLQFDGSWVEVDSTWDDRDPDFDMSDPNNAILTQAAQDPAFWGRIRHALFGLTTEQMNAFTPDDRYVYYTDAGYATFLSSSVHIRNTEENAAATQDYLSYLAPVADSTAYSYSALMGN